MSLKRNSSGPLPWICAVAASVAAAGWLWVLTCQFPTEGFNFLRLRPAFQIASGFPLYETAQTAPITTWMYGPVLPCLLWPATLAADSGGALMVASFINTAVLLLGLGWFCFRWNPALPFPLRLLAFATAILILPGSLFQYLQADNPACALGLVSMLALVRADEKGRWMGWVAAIAGVTAAGSKQLAVAYLAAQIIWLIWQRGAAAALAHALRCLVCAAVAGGLAIGWWGWEALWFKLIVVPSKLPFSRLPGRVLTGNAIALLGYLLLLGLAWRAARKEKAMALVALYGTCALPLGVAALLRGGGGVNSLHGLVLLAPAVLLSVLAEIVSQSSPRPESAENSRWMKMAIPVVLVAMVAARWPEATRLPHSPQLALAREAEALAQRHRGAIWFPWNPLATYYVERRHDHDEDGLYVRQESGLYPSRRVAEAGLPPAWRFTALNPAATWDVAPAMIPPGPRKFVESGGWLVVEHGEAKK